eukprot:Unigene13319_Nuclearia_a/m.40356 Unigene13319_Nuclearia_a/g.40356  ORF Unigene13319_Nuclearia_a/g.40356 Unigene13319_Nuclearia_a/m.40356 type:complete len:319 (-) Unigene13319_Nuclearia_a:29-985(-)
MHASRSTDTTRGGGQAQQPPRRRPVPCAARRLAAAGASCRCTGSDAWTWRSAHHSVAASMTRHTQAHLGLHVDADLVHARRRAVQLVDTVVDAQVLARAERHDSDLGREARALELAQELRQLRVRAAAVVDLLHVRRVVLVRRQHCAVQAAAVVLVDLVEQELFVVARSAVVVARCRLDASAFHRLRNLSAGACTAIIARTRSGSDGAGGGGPSGGGSSATVGVAPSSLGTNARIQSGSSPLPASAAGAAGRRALSSSHCTALHSRLSDLPVPVGLSSTATLRVSMASYTALISAIWIAYGAAYGKASNALGASNAAM